jgi:hypothetical protein
VKGKKGKEGRAREMQVQSGGRNATHSTCEGDQLRIPNIYDSILSVKGVKGLRTKSVYFMLEKRLEQPRICTNS